MELILLATYAGAGAESQSAGTLMGPFGLPERTSSKALLICKKESVTLVMQRWPLSHF